MAVITSNPLLTTTGVIYQGKVNGLSSLDLFVDDNGGGSTITVETSADNSSWSTLTVGVYKFTNGVLTSNGGGTFTAKGVYWIDLTTAAYLRISVTTYVSGNVSTRFEESQVAIRSLLMSIAVGLVGQGAAQGTALPLVAVFNQFATVAASTGAILPAGLPKNSEVVIKNSGANALTVYPPVGNALNGGSANAGVSLAAAGVVRYISLGDGNFYSF